MRSKRTPGFGVGGWGGSGVKKSIQEKDEWRFQGYKAQIKSTNSLRWKHVQQEAPLQPLPQRSMSQTFRAKVTQKNFKWEQTWMLAKLSHLSPPVFICTSCNKTLRTRFISNLSCLQKQANKSWSRSYSNSTTAQCSHCFLSNTQVGVFD